MLSIALDYLQAGWSVIPVGMDKKPLIAWKEFQTRRATVEEVNHWWAAHPQANIGIVTGAVSDLMVLDCDSAEGLQQIALHGGAGHTLKCSTGKGYHFYFRHPGGTVRNFARKLPGLDLRGDGGYVIAPPSVHATGTVYEWQTDCEPAHCPVWLLDLLQGPEPNPHAPDAPTTISLNGRARDLTPYTKTAVERELLELAHAPIGSQNHQLNKTAFALGQLVGAGLLDRAFVEAEIEQVMLTLPFDPKQGPWTHQNIQPTLRSGLNDGIANPRVVPELPPLRRVNLTMPTRSATHAGAAPDAEPPDFTCTDVGNADRLIWHHGEELRYSYHAKKWLVWDGAHWQWDDNGEIERRAEHTARSIIAEIDNEPDDKKREALGKHYAKSLSAKAISAMIERARSKVAIRIDALDSDPWLLNCLNGTLDLRTGRLYVHRKADLLTKLVPVEYDENAQCPVWLDFLFRTMDSRTDLVEFLHRAIGYTLTGINTEQCMFILHGSGSNGKSTLLSTLGALLCDYAMQTPAETLMAKRNDEGVRNDLARLRGARFVSAIETSEGKRLDEALIKQLTGGDKVAARFLFQEFFEFTPQFKTFLSTNHKPTVKGTDHAIWRRLHLVPFDVRFWDEDKGQTGDEALRMDKTLGARLADELPGILAWAVRGCLLWQQEGLRAPDAVKAATEKYKEEMDSLAEFITECCVVFPTAQCTARELYEKYTKWCDDCGEYRLPQKALGMRLQERGYEQKRGTGGTRQWKGIGLPTF